MNQCKNITNTVNWIFFIIIIYLLFTWTARNYIYRCDKKNYSVSIQTHSPWNTKHILEFRYGKGHLVILCTQMKKNKYIYIYSDLFEDI